MHLIMPRPGLSSPLEEEVVAPDVRGLNSERANICKRTGAHIMGILITITIITKHCKSRERES